MIASATLQNWEGKKKDYLVKSSLTSPVQKMKVDYVPSKFCQESRVEHGQQLSLTNSFVIH
jgi:hypothetical protein